MLACGVILIFKIRFEQLLLCEYCEKAFLNIETPWRELPQKKLGWSFRKHDILSFTHNRPRASDNQTYLIL